MSRVFNFRPKGFVQKGYIEGVPGWFESLRFTYRPISNKQRVIDSEKVNKLSSGAAEDFYNKRLVTSQLVQWDLTDQDGNALPIDLAAIDGMQNELLIRLTRICNGSQASDIDPAWAVEDQEESVDIANKATANGTIPGEEAESRLLKN